MLLPTATIVTNQNKPIQTVGSIASPFNMGSGHINPNSASDPGLVYPIDSSEYYNFLCSPDSGLGSPSSSADPSLFCNSYPSTRALDLNLPSISFYKVKVGRVVATKRKLRNVGAASTYTLYITQPAGATLKVIPNKLTFKKGASSSYTVSVTANRASSKVSQALLTKSTGGSAIQANIAWTFGAILWVDNLGHKVRIPVAVNAV